MNLADSVGESSVAELGQPPTKALGQRVAIVTGAAGGLGSAICETFEAQGASVVPVDLEGDGCFRADVGTAEGNHRMVQEAVERHGRVDVLVLSAGCQYVAPIPEFPEGEWDRLMNAMLKGPYLSMKEAWPVLTERPGGRIIVIASASSHLGDQFKCAYVAAKHGVLGLVKVAALEGGLHGLTANAIAPGWMNTPLVERQLATQSRLRGLSRDEVIAEMVSRHAVKRFVQTAEVAALAVFLASGASSAITGACIPVDLGMTAT